MDYTIIHVWHIVQNPALRLLLLFPVATYRTLPTLLAELPRSAPSNLPHSSDMTCTTGVHVACGGGHM